MNGTFGVGKTTVARRLVAMSDQLRLFDPEWVGYLLMNNLADHQFTDFQQLPPWRTLVPVVADELAAFTKQHLVAVQTVLHEEYWHELKDGLELRNHEVIHVVLDGTPDTLHARIESDPEGREIRQWRHDHVEAFMTQRPWLLASADVVIDTAAIDAQHAATAVFAQIQRGSLPPTREHPL